MARMMQDFIFKKRLLSMLDCKQPESNLGTSASFQLQSSQTAAISKHKTCQSTTLKAKCNTANLLVRLPVKLYRFFQNRQFQLSLNTVLLSSNHYKGTIKSKKNTGTTGSYFYIPEHPWCAVEYKLLIVMRRVRNNY